MVKNALRLMFLLSFATILFACSNEKKLEIEVKVALEGNPTAGAKVLINGIEEGLTDSNGQFLKVLSKKPGVQISLSVVKEIPGYRIEPWKDSFVMKLPEKGAVDRYSFQAELKATKYVTLVVTENGTPIKEAAVAIGGKEVGKTDDKGEFVYDYTAVPQKGLNIKISKEGYSSWNKTVQIDPGQKLDAPVSKQVVVTVSALTDEYGETKGIPGLSVTVNNKQVGKTGGDGSYTYIYSGDPGKKIKLAIAAPGLIPANWNTEVVLEGRKTIQRFFYSTAPKAIRVGVYGYASNTPDEDIKQMLTRIEEAVSNNLMTYSCFREVPGSALKEEIKRSKLNIEKITEKGWQETRLIRTVDMIILGSVTRDEKGMIIETKVHTSGGKLILSQINTAKLKTDAKDVAKEIVKNIIEHFPFEGVVVSEKDDLYQINLGSDYKIKKNMEFALLSSKLDKSGKVEGYREVGLLKVKKTEKGGSLTEISDIKKGEKAAIGDKVIRRVYREEEREAARKAVTITVKGGLPPDVDILGGVNIYLDEIWSGTTGPNGKAVIPIHLDKKYDLVLYRHGYKQLTDKLKVQNENESKEFVLEVNNAVFKIDSQPSGAEVLIDDAIIGKTPMLEGKQVKFGFHTLKLNVGGDYREWEEVVEFNEKVVDRTGQNKVVFFKDYLKIGQRAEQSGNIDAAISAYSGTEKGHPDYSAAHSKLAQLYMDVKNDYDSAIREFENVLTLPENQQLIYKQFAITYANLGHACYEKGNELVQKDRQAAAKHFAKAIENLQIAKQNIRFFPTQHYDAAVHDTYYYAALSYHKLYLITKKESVLDKTNFAWREYFDFFPKKLEGDNTFMQMRESAEKYWTQIKDIM